MDRPLYLSVKDYIIRKMAVKMMVPEKTLEAVINHQFRSANDALRVNESVEISGFGKFYFNRKKSYKRMVNLLSKKQSFENILATKELSEQRRATIHTIIANTIDEIETLKPRIHQDEFQAYLRGLEKQPGSSSSPQGDDKQDSPGENGHMQQLPQPL